MLKTLFRQLAILPIDENQPSDIRINSQNDFHYVLNRERSRADRSGLHFSIIVFDFTKIINAEASSDLLIKIMSERMRISDEIGWINKSKMGLMLYNTLLEQAKRSADAIVKRFNNAKKECPDISIFIYPDNAAKISSFTSDNRKIKRVELKLPLSLTVKDSDGENDIHNLKTKNISLNGVYFESEKILAVGTEVHLSIFLPIGDTITIMDDRIAVNVSGNVVRKDKKGMAISFKK